MALTPAQREARKGKLTGSSVAVLMEGNDIEILNLYYELTNDPRYVAKELDDVWAVQLGSHTEIFSLHWYARSKGYGPLIKKATTITDEKGCLIVSDIELYADNPVKKMGELVVHPEHPWVAATLDAMDTVENVFVVIECKHCGNFRKMADVIKKYMPQLHWQMFATQTRKIKLRVIVGANEPVDQEVVWDDFYWATLWGRAQEFWARVQAKKAPGGDVIMAPVVAKSAVEVVMKTINLKQMQLDAEVLPNWAPDIMNNLDVWLESVDAMKQNEDATKRVKELLPSDCGELIHHGVTVKRNKAGSVSITKAKE